MIVDLAIGGVLVPRLLVLAGIALIATATAIRLLRTTGLSRRLAAPALVEIAVFILILGLLAQVLPDIGSFL